MVITPIVAVTRALLSQGQGGVPIFMSRYHSPKGGRVPSLATVPQGVQGDWCGDGNEGPGRRGTDPQNGRKHLKCIQKMVASQFKEHFDIHPTYRSMLCNR